MIGLHFSPSNQGLMMWIFISEGGPYKLLKEKVKPVHDLM